MAISLTESAASRVRNYLQTRGESVGLRLGVTKTGCSGYSYVINYAEDITDADIVFEDKGVRIVVDPEGEPCRASIRWASLDRTAALPQNLDMRISTRADADGRFRIGQCGRGRYLLTAALEGCALCTQVVSTWGGAVEGVRMELQRAPESVLDVR